MAVERGEQPGVMGPGSFPIRDPRSKALLMGRMANPPRYIEFGGLDGPGRWYGHSNTHDQGGDKAIAKLESGGPTGVNGAKRTNERSMG